MKRHEAIHSIVENLSILQFKIQLLSKVNMSDLNILAEDIFAVVLNRLLNADFKNLNEYSDNYAAIDLADESKRISVQVTSDKSATKVRSTLKKFHDYKLENRYDKLILLVIADDKKYDADFSKDAHNLDYEIWFPSKIVKLAKSMELDCLVALAKDLV